VEHPIWQAAHLGVAALAGVFPEGVWKGDYLLERPQDWAVEGAAAGIAAGQEAGSLAPQFAGAARRADGVIRPGHGAR
jgi:hypothetical protein